MNSYRCDCNDTGYRGERCETNIDDCESSPCINGGTCKDEIKDYSCDCPNGYTGKACHIDIDECEQQPCQHGGLCLQRSNQTLYDPNFHSQFNTALPEVYYGEFNYSAAAG